MSRSGWCPPDQAHQGAHETCQRRQDAGQLRPCDCTDHGGHTHATTTREAA